MLYEVINLIFYEFIWDIIANFALDFRNCSIIGLKNNSKYETIF